MAKQENIFRLREMLGINIRNYIGDLLGGVPWEKVKGAIEAHFSNYLVKGKCFDSVRVADRLMGIIGDHLMALGTGPGSDSDISAASLEGWEQYLLPPDKAVERSKERLGPLALEWSRARRSLEDLQARFVREAAPVAQLVLGLDVTPVTDHSHPPTLVVGSYEGTSDEGRQEIRLRLENLLKVLGVPAGLVWVRVKNEDKHV